MYNAPSQFEVVRDTENVEAPLRIRLPPELKRTTWMTIQVVECAASAAMDDTSTDVVLSTYQYVIHSTTKHARSYLADLKRAQDSLFCQELFSQLCREAAAFRPTVPIYVIGDRITTHIFPGTKFIIHIHRSTDTTPPPAPTETERRWFCLEQLLNKVFIYFEINSLYSFDKLD